MICWFVSLSGKLGFCRMQFWHWVRYTDEKGNPAARRTHGLALQPRWDGQGFPPVHVAPPQSGVAALEVNHPFHFKLTPSMFLAPRCNHDLGVLLRIPEAVLEAGEDDNSADTRGALAQAVRSQLETIIDHEFYCAAYATKEQPHIEGLLQTLSDGLQRLKLETAQRRAAGEEVENLDVVRRVLHRLISSTNRRMHKGMPEMLSYLLGKPMYYSSHQFTSLLTEQLIGQLFTDPRSRLQFCVDHPARSAKRRYVDVLDYVFRPTHLEDFPLYFVTAACDVSLGALSSSSLPWYEYPLGPTGQVQRHPCYVQGKTVTITSGSMASMPLIDPKTGEPLHEYPYHLRLRTHEAWKVPVLYGRLPKRPDENSSLEEKGRYGLICMLLLRSWRGYEVVDFLAHVFAACGARAASDEAWAVVHAEYLRWRDGVAELGRPFFTRGGGPVPEPPVFGTTAWWACVVFRQMRYFDIGLMRLKHTVNSLPLDLVSLPQEVTPAGASAEPEIELDGGEHGTWDSDRLPSDPECDAGYDLHVHTGDEERPKRSFPPVDVLHCGKLPPGSFLEQFLTFTVTGRARSVEVKYLEEYAQQHGNVLSAGALEADVPSLASLDEGCLIGLSPGAVVDAAARQRQFFKEVDAYKLDENASSFAPPPANTASKSSWEARLQAGIASLPAVIPSPTIVVEAACFLILDGLLTIPDVKRVNVKAARALLHIAVWLQRRMLQRWYEAGQLSEPSGSRKCELLDEEFMLAIIGPGGTGKTTLLRCAEALIDHFAGPESVRKCAISNTAARLLKGDTVHALCKLPLKDLNQRMGRLSAKVLKAHRQRWASAMAVFMDEISMMDGEKLAQSDVRVRQAKSCTELRFGGTGVVFSGDFLQLPPVQRRSLAHRLGDTGVYEDAVSDDASSDGAETKHATAEARLGYELWRSVENVVSLSVNIRAPGVLSHLQAEMREGKISDAMWDLYMSRVVQPCDCRLQQPPFSTNAVHFVVHRHSIRVRQSFCNAEATCRRLRRRLYLVQAADAVAPEDEKHFTPDLRKNLLGTTK